MSCASAHEYAELLAAIGEGAATRERDCVDPRDQVEAVRAAGLTTFTLPTRLGGPGGSITELLQLIIGLAEADPIVAHVLRSHYLQIQLVGRVTDTDAQKRWATHIAAGKIFGNATSEKEGTLGTFENAIELVPCEDGYRLSGTKFYSTGTAYSDFVMVVARDANGRVVRANLPLERDGIEVLDDWDGIGQHRTGTGTTKFTDVLVTPDDFVQVTDPAHPPIASDAAFMQLYLQALMTGILRSVVTDACSLLQSRSRSFTHASTELPRHDPVLLLTVGQLAAATYGAEAAVLAAARQVDAAYRSEVEGAPDPELFAAASLAAAKAKVLVDQLGLSASAALFDVGGASSASRAKNLDRHWRNIRTLTLHNPTAHKAVAIGDLLVNGSPLPTNGYF